MPPPTGTLLKFDAVKNSTSTSTYKVFWNQWCLLDVIDLTPAANNKLGIRLGNFKRYVKGAAKEEGYWSYANGDPTLLCGLLQSKVGWRSLARCAQHSVLYPCAVNQVQTEDKDRGILHMHFVAHSSGCLGLLHWLEVGQVGVWSFNVCVWWVSYKYDVHPVRFHCTSLNGCRRFITGLPFQQEKTT